MNCDKRFLGCLQLETCGYALGLLHFGASVTTIVLYLNHAARLQWDLWVVCVGLVLWLFHFVASILLFVGTMKRKSVLLIPFITLYTIFFMLVATFAAFCVLEGIATGPKPEHKKTNMKVNNSTLEMKRKMKEFKQNFIPPLKLSGVSYLLLMVTVTVVCLCCVYILSCICSLYDKLKDSGKEQKCLPVLGNIVYGAVRESECSES